MKIPSRAWMLLWAVFALLAPPLSAQVTNVVFSEDFSGPLNTNKLVPDNLGFEGGKGTIAPIVANGVVEFTGAVTEQWWAGAALSVNTNFPASDETNIVFSVDRVAEAGSGTGHRSSMWIMDANRSRFVLFGSNSENSWQFNRNIGETGDNPTGGGTVITPFSDTFTFDDGSHTMKAVANGKTVKLYLDDVFGTEVRFPFSPVTFKFGSYARANDDIADSTFDNVKVETVGAIAFSATTAQLFSSQTISNVIVRIPQGANSSQAVAITVTSSDPTIAIPSGGTGGTFTLNFPAGGTNQLALPIQSVGPSGGAIFTLTNSLGISVANQLQVVVLANPGVLLSDDFAGGSVDSTKWQVNNQGFEVGVGTFTVEQTGGQLVISGIDDQEQYWAGASIKSVKSFTATPDVPLAVDVDRVSINPLSSDTVTPSTAARTGVFLTTADRSQFVFFAQNVGETGWEVNSTAAGTTTGSGTAIPQFSSMTDTNSHHMRLVANGASVEVFLDGVSGGTFPFPVSAGIYVEVGAYTRALNDAVTGVFDNLKVEGITPPMTVGPGGLGIFTAVGNNTNLVTVTVPKSAIATKALNVTATSQNPSVAIPENAVNGALALQFAAGSTNVRTFRVVALSPGTTTLTFTNDQGIAVANSVAVTVTSPLGTVFSDAFASATVDTNKLWRYEDTALDARSGAEVPGILSPSSALIVTNGALEMLVIAADPGDANQHYPGITLHAQTNLNVSATSPAIFEIDRTQLQWKLVTGTSAKQITGVWVFDQSGNNYVFFNEYVTHDGTAGGWVYNAATGATNDNPVVTGTATAIPAFGPSNFNDQGNHRIRVVANGTDVKLYLDGVFGAAVPFPFSQGVHFAFGTYVGATADEAYGYFDNAVISAAGGSQPSTGSLSASLQTGGQITISWTGTGTLESASSITGSWTAVTPAPTGNSVTVSATGQQQQFYRLRQ